MTAAAQGTSVLGQLCAKMASSAAVMNYEYTLASSNVKNLGNGVLTAQQRMYLMQGNGLKIYCNASTVWVVDEEGKEIGEHDAYSYQRVLVETLEKGAVVNAIIRLSYPQDAVEAIMRHKIAGDEGADAEFGEFNAYAEFAKAEADKILND